MTPTTVDALTTVIVPCWNQVQFTRKCIAALMRLTAPPWELVVINNGSTDRTGDYLAGVQDASPVPVTVISNASNRGFPTAINQGLEHARGDYFVLLNNDVVVTEGWLEHLIGLAAMPTPKSETEAGGESMEIGLVGPMSNYAAPPQLVEEVPYRDLDEMNAFARQWREQHRGTWFMVPKLSGFCLLMKRAVYEAIGGLDEQFGLGFFDDDDLAERARRAGFSLAVAHDLFVHHFGSRTFAGNGIDANRLLEENATKFAAKWGNSVPQGQRVQLRPFSGRPQRTQDRNYRPQMTQTDADGNDRIGSNAGAGKARTRNECSEAFQPFDWSRPDFGSCFHRGSSADDRARVSLTMIVKNEEKNIGTCLESVRGVFDEIVVVDTGSTDRTIEIARSFGARVFDFVWVDDFAAARNAALARATGDYAFWLDADDLVEPPQRQKLEVLLARLRAGGGNNPSAFVVRCACDPGPDGSGGETVVDHVRLFPLIEGVRWSYRVHEQILPALNRAGIGTEWTDITVRHTGYSDRALRLRKLDRDTRILHEELADRPDDPFTLFNLGSVGVERAQWNEAIRYLKRSLARSAPTDSITRKLFALIARCHQMLGDFPTALNCCAEGLSLDPGDAELWFRKAVVHRQSHQPAEAEDCWRRILTLSRPQKFASMDQGIFGHLTRRNLAVLAKARGDHREAERQWRAVLAECPGDAEALQNLEQITNTGT
jgi:glycosyltransferase involved in cell wall biosynthesis